SGLPGVSNRTTARGHYPRRSRLLILDGIAARLIDMLECTSEAERRDRLSKPGVLPHHQRTRHDRRQSRRMYRDGTDAEVYKRRRSHRHREPQSMACKLHTREIFVDDYICRVGRRVTT
ncbi:hypothetical protein PV05_07282, partial [Exophiala xenobiotica]